MEKRYLNVISLDEITVLLENSFLCSRKAIRVPLEESVGAVTAVPIFARYSVPEIHLAAMDGIAVISSQTHGASEQNPVTLPDAVRVNTGNVIPTGFDAVVMIEDVWVDRDRFTIRKAIPIGQHIRPAGEDLAESEMVVPGGHRIRPHELGALAAYGITELDVITLSIGLVPTGNELVPFGIRPAPGQVVESNTIMAGAILAESGARCIRYPIVQDNPSLIREAVIKAVEENDIIIISAGSSVGTRDFTASVIAELGEVLVHGVAIKPGKPVILGKIKGKAVFGLPGYPLSALVVTREIILPFLRRFGLPVPEQETVPAYLTTPIGKEVGSSEFVQCTLGKISNRWVLTPQSRGAGVQMSAVRANAFLKIPADREGYERGNLVEARLTVPKRDAENALLLTGSHDPVLDYLADLLQRRGVPLLSTHVGSMNGLLALHKNECYAAPIHLLSPDGCYNVGFLKKYLPETEVVLVSVAGREQGIVSKDGITLTELRNHTFINRQKGSGTRLLLDYQLRKAAISPEEIRGYEREVNTHIAVALAVKSGEADAGMCVFSAAKALGLRFIPVAQEKYEIAIRTEHLPDPRIVALIETIRDPRFREILSSLGGYDTAITGQERMVSGNGPVHEKTL